MTCTSHWRGDTYLVLEPYRDEAVKGLAALDDLELFARTECAYLRGNAEKKTNKGTLHPGAVIGWS